MALALLLYRGEARRRSMKTATGIFEARDDAEAAIRQLRDAGFGADQLCMLSPDTNGQADCIKTAEGEQPGMGKVIGGVVGGAVGASGGLPLGLAISSALFPGVGPVLAAGFITAALAGTAGVAGGAAAGGALENALTNGLPRDELYYYEHALGEGRAIVIVRTEDQDQLEDGQR